MKKNIQLEDLNERRTIFLNHYVETGDELAAYEAAGFAMSCKNWRGEARKMLRALSDYVELAVKTRIGSHVPMAVQSIAHLAKHASSEMVRLNAAKDLLSRSGYDSAKVIEDRRDTPSTMDREELLKELADMLNVSDPRFIEKLIANKK
jgi:hypothetical protein